MTTKSAKFCVYASHGTDAIRRTYAYGDGGTASTRCLFAICETEEEAERELARLMATQTMTRVRMPGDGIIYPVLEVGAFDPRQYVGRQNREQYYGRRLANLVRDLYDEARRNAEAL